MQYSKDRYRFPLEMDNFDAIKIGKSLGLKSGDILYYREGEGDIIKQMPFVLKK